MCAVKKLYTFWATQNKMYRPTIRTFTMNRPKTGAWKEINVMLFTQSQQSDASESVAFSGIQLLLWHGQDLSVVCQRT